MSEMFALAPWLETLRDTAVVAAAFATCLVTVSAAAKLPVISRPVRWIGRTFFAGPLEGWLSRFLNEHQAPIHDTITSIAGKVDETAAKVDEVDDRLKVIEHEVTPNNGTSLRDAVTRTETKCATLEQELLAFLSNAPKPQANPGLR